MAVYLKAHLEPFLQELETYYQALRRAVEGQKPNADLAERYHANPEQFEREFREVDITRVLTQVEYFKVAVGTLKHLKDKAQKPVGR